MLTIKKLPEERWIDCRKLRLEALQQEPLAFGTSLSEAKTLSEAEWRKRIHNVWFALVEDQPVGMIGRLFDPKLKTQHIAHIFGVYVQREYRGHGIAKQLMQQVLEEIERNNQTVKIRLGVNPAQKAALQFYKNFGFEIVGKLKKELKVEGKFYDEYLLERFL